MTEKLICTYPPQYDGHIGKWAIGVAQWLYQELTKILGMLGIGLVKAVLGDLFAKAATVAP